MSWVEEFGNWRHFLNECKEIGYREVYPYAADEDDMIHWIRVIDPTVEWFLVQTTWPQARKALTTILWGNFHFSKWTIFQTPDRVGVVLAFTSPDDVVVFRLAL